METTTMVTEAVATRGASLIDTLREVRERTTTLASRLSAEDACVQGMPDASPAKWHLAHTTWFFEHFVLDGRMPEFVRFNERYDFLYNSYYYTVGQMHSRPHRGLMTRPSLEDIKAYRHYVDAALDRLLAASGGEPEMEALVRLGMHHEQQHQELLLTDIKYLFAQNPLLPAYVQDPTPALDPGQSAEPLQWIKGAAGIVEVGHGGGGFAFDNETPRHRVLLREHALGSRLVTNAEFREFIADGGYENPALWLSDGWSQVIGEGWSRPLYWQEDLEAEFTLGGLRELCPAAPVVHLSYFEADSFARWAGCRLPTETEWETAAERLPVVGNLGGVGLPHPQPAGKGSGLQQIYGDTWEWTASPYAPYPGFRPLAGSLGEYNGKFMCSQMVLRGGSCATPSGHIRPTYRNFFYPHQRWQFSGVRLARDGT